MSRGDFASGDGKVSMCSGQKTQAVYNDSFSKISSKKHEKHFLVVKSYCHIVFLMGWCIILVVSPHCGVQPAGTFYVKTHMVGSHRKENMVFCEIDK